MKTKARLVVFDLDGTLALTEHRNHFVERPVGEKNWNAFFDACDRDELNWPIAMTLLSLYAAGCDVQIWSGRTDRVRAKTENWLLENGLGQIPLRMRQESDHRADVVLKKEWLDAEDQKPTLVFEDRATVVAMWRENGVVCAQIAPGAF